MLRLRPQVDELLLTKRTHALQLRNHDGALDDHLIPLIIVEGNRPTAELVVAFHSIDQMTVEGIPPHFTVGDHIQSRFDLESNRLIHSPVLDLLEIGMGQFARLAFLARFFEIIRSQKTTNYITSIR